MEKKTSQVEIIRVSNWRWFELLSYQKKESLIKALNACRPFFPESYCLFLESLLNYTIMENLSSVILFKSNESGEEYELIIEKNVVTFAGDYKELLFKCEIVNKEGKMRKYTKYGLEIFKSLFEKFFEEKDIPNYNESSILLERIVV